MVGVGVDGRLPGEPPEATFAALGDTQVHYVDRAPAEGAPRGTVVLVHGFGASVTAWAPLVPVFIRKALTAIKEGPQAEGGSHEG